MTKDKIKKFVKENKEDLIACGVGLATLTALAIAIVTRKSKLSDFTDSVDPLFLDLLNTVDKASEGCTHYCNPPVGELWACFDKDGNVCDALRHPSGELMDVKNIIVFGTKVET